MDTAWTVVEILQWRRHCGTHLKRHRLSNEDDSFNHAACQEKYRRLQRILDSSFSSPSPPPPHYQLSLLFSASDFLSSAPSSTSLISSFSSFGLFQSSCLCLSRFLFVCLQMTLSVCLCINASFMPTVCVASSLSYLTISGWQWRHFPNENPFARSWKQFCSAWQPLIWQILRGLQRDNLVNCYIKDTCHQMGISVPLQNRSIGLFKFTVGCVPALCIYTVLSFKLYTLKLTFVFSAIIVNLLPHYCMRC